MVDFMLENPGMKAGKIELEYLSVTIQRLDGNLFIAGHFTVDAGNAQAAFHIDSFT